MAAQSLTLECDANGFPAPEITWLKDGRQVGVPPGWMCSGWDVGMVQAFWTGSFSLPDVAGSCGKVTGVFGGALGARAMGVPSLWPHDEAWRAAWWRGHRTFLGSSHQPAPWASVSSLLLGARGWPDPPLRQLPRASSAQIPAVGGHRLLDGARALHFPRIQEGDSGLYSCRAENQAGIAQRDFDLLVLSE